MFLLEASHLDKECIASLTKDQQCFSLILEVTICEK